LGVLRDGIPNPRTRIAAVNTPPEHGWDHSCSRPRGLRYHATGDVRPYTRNWVHLDRATPWSAACRPASGPVWCCDFTPLEYVDTRRPARYPVRVLRVPPLSPGHPEKSITTGTPSFDARWIVFFACLPVLFRCSGRDGWRVPVAAQSADAESRRQASSKFGEFRFIVKHKSCSEGRPIRVWYRCTISSFFQLVEHLYQGETAI